MSNEPKYLTEKKALKFLRDRDIPVSDTSLSRMRQQKKGPKFTKKFCNRVLYRQDWLVEWAYGGELA